MIFASPIFLFFFFPITVIIYALLPLRWRNTLLLIASGLFYVSGSGPYILVIVGLTIFNSVISPYIIDNRRMLIGAITVNLIPLVYFKYVGFFEQIWYDVSGTNNPQALAVLLPLGISFYTFHAISYLIDVARGRIPVNTKVDSYLLYMLFFPHLIAGPIVRFKEISSQFGLENRRIRPQNISSGLQLFVLGFSKKILIGDQCAAIADRVFNQHITLSSANAWLGILAYTMQIYFDFSGYSDMASGLARIFGFRFPRNFRRPYSAQSITEFWQRWHISLSRWFRDYVYIPLGGNRRGQRRTLFNLWVIFVLCGLWHGANYTFLVWGVGHGIWMVVERLKWWRPQGWWGQLCTFVITMLLWVPFRAESLTQTWQIWLACIKWQTTLISVDTVTLIDPKRIFLLVLALCICCMPQRAFVHCKLFWQQRPFLRTSALSVSFALAILVLVDQGFTPFIYANF
jgi:alginate O-acetyltransferase complex protein AlgI